MKRNLMIGGALVALLCMAVTAMAFTGILTKSATHATMSRVVLSGKKGYKTAVLALNATSDKSGAVITIYDKSTVWDTADGACATNAAVIPVSDTTGFAQNDIIVGQAPNGTNAAYLGVVTSVQAGVSITLVANTAQAVVSGDYIYKMESLGTIPVGAATVALDSDVALISGEAYSPLMLTLDSTSAGAFNFVTGYFVQ